VLLVSETFAATITIVVVVVARILSLPRRILHLLPSRIQREKDPVLIFVVVWVTYCVVSNFYNDIHLYFKIECLDCAGRYCFRMLFCCDILQYVNVVGLTSHVGLAILRMLVAGFSPRRAGFDSRSCYVGFVIDSDSDCFTMNLNYRPGLVQYAK
jgi:hypothetical protein